MLDLTHIATEARNPRSTHIDECGTLSMLEIINAEDKKIAVAVEAILPSIAKAVDAIVAAFRHGGRLFYLGAGTSGRLGILDAVECPPTYSTDPDLVQGLIAGGCPAIFRAQEGAEDSEDLAMADLQERGFCEKDILVGIAASGRTPYVVGGLRYAKSLGAATIAIACTPGSPIAALADIPLVPLTGPEVITGSTRMKAGTATKMILNMLSTGAMIRMGKTYGNLMVDVKASNKKLEERSRRIVMEAVGCTREDAVRALEETQGHAKLAIFLLLSGESIDRAKTLLDAAEGHMAEALRNLRKERG